MINDIAADLIKATWQLVKPGGLLIVHQNKYSQSSELNPEQIESLLSTLGTTRYYSSIAASEHKANVDISHYSLIIEQELKEENSHKEGVFWVVQK